MTSAPPLALTSRPAAPGVPVGAGFLLVHGLASNARLWDGVAEHLAALGHPSASVDLRGHGRSFKPEDGYDIPTVSENLVGVLATLAAGEAAWVQPVVVGQSWGGNVVLELAARHPGPLSGVACVDGGTIDLQSRFPSWEECAAVLAPPRLRGTPFATVEAWVRRAHPDWPESGIQGTLANFEVLADGTVAPWLTFANHLKVLRGLWDHRPSSLYPLLSVPVLLIPADDGHPASLAAKRAEVAAAVAAIPTVAVHWFSADHDIHAQYPAELAAALHEGFPGSAP